MGRSKQAGGGGRAGTGRPRIYGELTRAATYNLPESLQDRIVVLSEQSGMSRSMIVTALIARGFETDELLYLTSDVAYEPNGSSQILFRGRASTKHKQQWKRVVKRITRFELPRLAKRK